MKNVKKVTSVFCAAALAVAPLAFSACSPQAEAKYKVYMPDGAPAVALAKLMNDGYADTAFYVVPNSAKVTIAQHVAKGDADLAILPVNAAATLYNGGTEIVMLSVNTHGNLFVIGDGDAITPEELVGKRLGVIGQGNVPEHALRMLFESKGIELSVVTNSDTVDGKVAVRFVGAGDQLAPLIKKGEVDYGYLAEPAVTTVSTNLNKSIVMDMQEQWQTAFGSEFPQAVLVAKKSLVETDKEYVDGFLTALKASDGWAENNAEATVNTVGAHMPDGVATTLATLTEKSIKGCNIRTVAATDAKSACELYFEKLLGISTDIGQVISKKPDDGFYYKG